MSRAERAVPPPGPDQALGRGLANIVAMPVRDLPRGRAIDKAAGAAAAARAKQEAARAAYVASLERRAEELEDENRGLRIRLEELEAEHALAVAEAVRETEHRILGRERKTVAGHRMPSILEG